jgi:hypothetical protein
LPIVTPMKKDNANRYIAREGNRRLAALKALENPDALVGASITMCLRNFESLVVNIARTQLITFTAG